MENNGFDFDNMDDGTMDILMRMVIGMKLESMPSSITALLTVRFPGQSATFTAEYVDRLACACYTAAIAMPEKVRMMAGGIVNIARISMSVKPEIADPDFLMDKLTQGFAEFSPEFASHVTRELVVNTAKLCLLDWLESEPSEESMHCDMHMYFGVLMDMNGAPSMESVRREVADHIASASPEELADISPELLDMIQQWKDEQDPE